MKKFIIIFLLIALALPAAVFATEEAPGGYETLQIEYRYAEGQTPDILPTIERFGMTFYLVGQSEPMLEGEMPEVRTYRFRINGYLTQEQIDEIWDLYGITITPVPVEFEREVDKERKVTMPTNDVDDIIKQWDFEVTSATEPGGKVIKTLDFTGVSFVRNGYEVDSEDPNGLKLPATYTATIVYRGVETYLDTGYYYADAVFETEEIESEVPIYVIVADYRSDFIPGDLIIEEIDEIDGDGGEGVPLSDEENILAMVENQSGNILTDILNGDVPLGSPNITGVWSFLSLLFSVAGIAIACIFAIGAFFRRRQATTLANMGVYDEDWLKLMSKRGAILRLLTIIVGVITLIAWLFIDDFTLGVVWINSYTVPIGLLFAITIALCIVVNIRDKKIYAGMAKEEDRSDELVTA